MRKTEARDLLGDLRMTTGIARQEARAARPRRQRKQRERAAQHQQRTERRLAWRLPSTPSRGALPATAGPVAQHAQRRAQNQQT